MIHMQVNDLDLLRDEVAVLREELAALRLEVARLRRVAERPQSISGGGYQESEAGSDPGFGGAPSATVASLSVRSLGSSVGSSAPTGFGGPAPQPIVQSWEQRERIATGVGAFFRRSLAGDHRGTSGREQLRLASRLWIVVRSIRGEVFSPVRIFRSWARAKELVKVGNSAGDAIFVGLPSEREARVCIAAAGLEYPAEIEG